LIKMEEEDNSASIHKYRVFSLMEQLTFHGDPAISLFTNNGPDFITDFSTINTIPEVVSTNIDSFEVNFDVVNLGSVYSGPLNGYVIHKFDNKLDTVPFTMTAPYERENVTVKIGQKGIKSIGKNLVEIVLDPANDIPELPNPAGESNNDIESAYGEEGYCFFVFDNNAIPIHPSNFAIVNEQNVRLIASANNALLAVNDYIIELDTTALFDSPALMTEIVSAGGGMISWTPSTTLANNQVYYWRIKNNNPDIQSDWQMSSFVYLEGSSEGWNQSHFYQWKQDDLETAIIDDNSRVFEFADDFKTIIFQNGVFPGTLPSATYQSEPFEFIEWDGPVKSGIWITVFDEFSGEPWVNHYPGDYGSHQPTDWAEGFIHFPYWTRTEDERAPAIEFLTDIIPDGAYVSVMTIMAEGNDFLPGDWNNDPGVNLYNFLESQGATKVDDLAAGGSQPYLFVFKKNDNSFTPEEYLVDQAEMINVEIEISAKWFEGTMKTPSIGPAAEWENLVWELGDLGSTDTIMVRLIGQDADGNETVLYDDITENDFSLSGVDADVYPYLRLEFYSYDDLKRTSAYLDHWRVHYTELPELVLNTNENFVFVADTLSKGTNLQLNAFAENIKDIDMDSVTIKYNIVDISNNEKVIYSKTAPATGLSKVPIEFSRSTDDLNGAYEFRIEINHDREQKEEFYFNNLGVLNFFVRGDGLNPLLDVTFDGIHIMKGDIVSSEPIIMVELTDAGGILLENRDDFELVLEKEDGSIEQIDVNGPDVQFFPADSTGTNSARLEYTPSLESGIYNLYVQAKDASGNFSGDQDLSFCFEVIKESQISKVLNFPNPFSTSTQFIFTITGSVVPENFHIKVMTLSGKVVKEITAAELGPIHVGLNRSTYKWDGTDEYGSKLANGVYLYKAYSSFDTEANSEYQIEGIDQFFKKGFGKLVIMR